MNYANEIFQPIWGGMESFIGEQSKRRKYKLPIRLFQKLDRKCENLKESKHFQGLNYNNGKFLKLSLAAGELEQILYFKGFVIKTSKTLP